jgi:hypothetical protein
MLSFFQAVKKGSGSGVSGNANSDDWTSWGEQDKDGW